MESRRKQGIFILILSLLALACFYHILPFITNSTASTLHVKEMDRLNPVLQKLHHNKLKWSTTFVSNLHLLQKLIGRLQGKPNISQFNITDKELKVAHVNLQDMIKLLTDSSKIKNISSLDIPESGNTKKNNNSTLLDVCPELHKGTKRYQGFVLTNCTNVKRFEDVITAVFNFVHYPIKYKSTIMETIKGFAKKYPKVNVLVAVPGKNIMDQDNMSWKVSVISNATHEAKVWNQLITQVNTSYTFLAKDILTFNEDCHLERLVWALSNLNVSIAGGAIRSPEGYWNRACYQSVFRNYTLIYDAGYHHSSGDCIWCSHIIGPFVGRTAYLKNLKFNEAVDSKFIFEEYFLQGGHSSSQSVVCPDSMFNVHSADKRKFTKSLWLPFAKRWKINKLRFGLSNLITFTCKELGLGCGWVVGQAMPPCCLQDNADVVKFFIKTCDKHGIICEVCDGTLLGPVKFGKVLPWERDGDLLFLNSNHSVLKGLTKTFQDAGYSLIPSGRHFNLKTPYWRIEIWGFDSFDTTVALKHNEVATKVLFDGTWVNAARNPGNAARQRYGPEIYKHAQHWMSLRYKDSWQVYKSGKFTKCAHPGQHNCLDQYKGDGSFQFDLPKP